MQRMSQDAQQGSWSSTARVLASTLVLTGMLVTTAQADVVSWNWDRYGTLSPTDVAGVVPVANWSSSWPDYPDTDLVDDSGAVTPIDITWDSFNDWSIMGSHPGLDGDGAANKEMLNGYLNSGPAGWDPPITYSEIVFNEIPYATYDIYVYFSSDVAGREGEVRDGTTTYYFNTLGPASTSGSNALFVQTTDSAATYTTAANYAVFSNLSGTTQTVQVEMRDIDEWAGIAGFQVVDLGGVPATAWDGDADNQWSVAANWVDDTLPNFTGFVDPLYFDQVGTAGGTLLNNVVAAELGGMTFMIGADAFTLTGNALDLSGAITNFSTNTQTLAMDINAAVALNVNPVLGPIELSGVLSGSTGFTKSGSETLTLSNSANDISGTITFNGTGSIVVAAGGALGDPNAIIQINAASAGPMGTLAFDGSVSQSKIYELGSRGFGDAAHFAALSGANTVNGLISGGDGDTYFNIDTAAGASLEIAADFVMTPDQDTDLILVRGNGDVSLTGQLDDAAANSVLGVHKIDAGTLEIVGPKDYSGATWVDKGVASLVDPASSNNVPNSWILQAADPNATLDFSGLMGGGIILADGQILSGGGVFVGSVATSSGSILSPGWWNEDPIGTMTLPALTLVDGAQINIETSLDQDDMVVIDAGGSLVGPASGTVNINVDPTAGIADGDHVVLDWSAASSVVGVDLADFTTNVGTLSIAGSKLILSVELDLLADVLVSDPNNNRVMQFNTTQFGLWIPDAVQPVFAEGTVGDYELDSPRGLAKDSSGNVYIAEGNTDLQDRVLKVDASGNFLATVAEVDSFDALTDFSGTPAYLVVDPTDTYLYMSIAQPNSTAPDPNLDDVIYRIDLSGATGPVVVIDKVDANNAYELENPQGLAFGPDGYLYVSNNYSGSSTSTLGNLTLVNGNFNTGAPEFSSTDVDEWFDGTAVDGQDAFHISYNTPDGTPVLGLSDTPIGTDPGVGAWAYQSLGVDGSLTSLPVRFDWGTFTDRDGQDLGVTISVYESDGSFVPDEGTDIDSAAGVTLLDSQSVSALDTSFGAYFTDELMTFDLSAQTGGELFIRINNYEPAGSDAECWAVVDNVSIGAAGPAAGSRILRFDVSGSTGVFAGTLTTEHRDTKGLFYDKILDRLLVSLNALNDIWAYTDLTQDYVANDPANGAFEAVFEQDAEEDYPDVVSVAGEVYFTDSTSDTVRKVTPTGSIVAVGDWAGLSGPHSLLVLSEFDPFDFDLDGDVDADDAAVMMLAVNGPDVTTAPLAFDLQAFERADIDNDGDVDMDDVAVFARRMNN